MGNLAAGGEPRSNHQYGRALDFNQHDSSNQADSGANYNVWVAAAATNAAHRFLYDQNDNIVNNTLISQYPWPAMPPGVTRYSHGHVDW